MIDIRQLIDKKFDLYGVFKNTIYRYEDCFVEKYEFDGKSKRLEFSIRGMVHSDKAWNIPYQEEAFSGQICYRKKAYEKDSDFMIDYYLTLENAIKSVVGDKWEEITIDNI